jgi:hypothetical protein
MAQLGTRGAINTLYDEESRLLGCVLTDVSEERIASIFRVEVNKKSASEPA